MQASPDVDFKAGVNVRYICFICLALLCFHLMQTSCDCMTVTEEKVISDTFIKV